MDSSSGIDGKSQPARPARPLCVDLDGTLIRTDLLHESLFAALRSRPALLFRLPVWLAAGKARLKEELARHATIDADTLPYNPDVLAYLEAERAAGRPLVLATASDRKLADAVANSLGIFDRVLATENGVNLAGESKARALRESYGDGGFDYLGDSAKDVPVWKHAATVLAVGSYGQSAASRAGLKVARAFERQGGGVAAMLKAMRPHQWLKNLLLFAVLLAAHRFTELNLVVAAFVGFVSFGLCASGVYLLNDLLDVHADRRHPRKRRRPIAAGDLPIASAVILAVGLLILAFLLTLLLPPLFSVILAIYYVSTLAYSLWLKRKVLVDVMMLAGLYTLRVIAGGAAVSIMPSFWLLMFSMFLFLSLALAKRYAELIDMRARNLREVEGRGYRINDEETLAGLGASAGYVSVLVVALYINGEVAHSLYRTPEAIWLICPLMLYWIGRVWMAARRGKLTDDPVVFAIRDGVSRAVFVLCGLIFIFASYVAVTDLW